MPGLKKKDEKTMAQWMKQQFCKWNVITFVITIVFSLSASELQQALYVDQ